MKLIKYVLSFIVLLVLAGCSTTYITSTWRAPDAGMKKYGKIMVVGIVRQADRTIRQQMEAHLAGDLKELGYHAVSSYEVYGPKAFQDMTEERVNKKLAKDGVDAVLTVVLLDKQKEKHYVPGRVVFSPYITYHRQFWGYYHSLYTRIEAPGYYEVTTRYFWESNFYDLTEGQLLYSVQTQSFDPESVNMLAHQYAQKIIQSMVKSHLIEKQPDKEKAM